MEKPKTRHPSDNQNTVASRRPKASSPASVSSDKLVTSSSIPRLRVSNSNERSQSGDDPKSDSALLKPGQRQRKENSVSPFRTKSKIARPIQQKGQAERPDGVNSLVKPENQKVEKTLHATRGISPGGGVLYITENLIQKVTQVEYLHRVTEINLCLRNSKKIKFVEKLDGLYNLKRLILSHNIVEKVSGLEKLTKLEYIDLSHNLLTLIGDNFEHLGSLEHLDLSFNKIAGLSKNFGKNLHSLKILRLDNNDLKTFKSCAALENLSNLGSLKLENNPFCNTTDYWQNLVVYKVPTLSELDGRELTSADHKEAHERFGRIETDRLWAELQKTSNDLLNEKALEKELREQNEKLAAQNKQLNQWKSDNQQKIVEFQRETENNNELLVQKTKEMNKLLDKNYELEQELAFFKIDKKFGHQGEISDLTAPDNSDLSDDMPYIGKSAGFMPKQRPTTLNPGDVTDTQNSNSRDINENRRTSLEKDGDDRNQNTRLKTMEDKFALAEKRLDDLQSNLASIENNAQNPEYFRNRDPPPFVENLSPHYLPGPQTGYQGFREHGGQGPDVPYGRSSRIPASTYSLKRESEFLHDETPLQGHSQFEESSVGAKFPAKPKQPKNRPTVTFKDGDEVNTNASWANEMNPESKSGQPKPLLDDAIVKYQNLQSELDEMLRMVRQETATVIGLEKQLNIQPSHVPSLNLDGDFEALNYSDESLDEPIFFPEPVAFQENCPFKRGRSFRGAQRSNGTRVNRAAQKPNDLQRAPVNRLGKPKKAERIQDSSELRFELTEMTKAICSYMQKLKSDIEKLKSVNHDLEANLVEIKLKETKTSDTLQKMKIYQHRLEEFLLQMKDVFHEYDSLELENNRLIGEFKKYPSLRDIDRLKSENKNFTTCRSENFKLEKLINNLRSEVKQSREKEAAIMHKLSESKNNEEKLQTECLNVKTLLAQTKLNFDETSKQLSEVTENFNNYSRISLNPEHLLRHFNTLTQNLGQPENPDPLEFITSSDSSFEHFSVFRKRLLSKLSDFNTEKGKIVSEEKKLRNDFDAAQKEIKKVNDVLEKMKVEHSDVREKNRKSIECKIQQWKNKNSRVKEKSETERAQLMNEIEASNAEQERLRLQIDKFEKELILSESSLNEAKNSLELERQQVENWKKEVREKEIKLKSDLEDAKREIKDLIIEKNKDQNNHLAIEKQNQVETLQLREENEKLSRTLLEVEKTCEQLRSDVNKIKTKEKRLANENEDISERCEQLERDLQSSESMGAIKMNKLKQTFDDEINRTLSVISTQECNITMLNESLFAEKAENSRLQDTIGFLKAQLLKERNGISLLEKELDYVSEKLEAKNKLVDSISQGMNNLQDVEEKFAMRKQEYENLQCQEKKLAEKLERYRRNWSQFREIVTQNSGSGDLLQFLEEKISPILFLNNAKNIVEQWERRKSEVEQFEELLAIENETYEQLKEKNELLKTDVNESRRERRIINDEIEIMKQLVEVSKMQTFNDNLLDTL